MKSGMGRKLNDEGGLYEGYFANNKENGEGRLIYENGDFYEGQFVDG